MIAPAPYAAFFDVDGTLITERSLLGFLDFVREQCGWDDEPWFKAYYARLGELVHAGASRAALNEFFYCVFREQSVARVNELGLAWYRRASARPGFFKQRVVDELRRHRAQQAQIVLVSGSFLPVLAPLQEALGVDDVLASELEVDGSVYTGRLRGKPCIGPGKAVAVRAYLERHGLRAELCHAYGDDASDREMLELVGHGHLLQPSDEYAGELQRRSWSVPSAREIEPV